MPRDKKEPRYVKRLCKFCFYFDHKSGKCVSKNRKPEYVKSVYVCSLFVVKPDLFGSYWLMYMQKPIRPKQKILRR